MDTAHWPVPCRYVLLACLDPGSGSRESTVLDYEGLPFTAELRGLLRSTPFRVVNGKSSFFSTILDSSRAFIRFDPGCMKPVTRDGTRALSLLDDAHWPDHTERIRWHHGKVVLIDNWRVLHGRGVAATADTDRILLRVYLSGEAK